MELDIALATKFSVLEKEEQNTMLQTILSAIDNVLRVNGAKVPKRKPTKSIIVPYRDPNAGNIEDDVPNINVLLQQYGGGAVIDMSTLEGLNKNGKHS